jgi:hypothetical protein
MARPRVIHPLFFMMGARMRIHLEVMQLWYWQWRRNLRGICKGLRGTRLVPWQLHIGLMQAPPALESLKGKLLFKILMYRSERKVEKIKNLTIFWWPGGNSLNIVISEIFSSKSGNFGAIFSQQFWVIDTSFFIFGSPKIWQNFTQKKTHWLLEPHGHRKALNLWNGL